MEALLLPHLQPRKVRPVKVSDLSMVTQPDSGSALNEVHLVPSPSSQPSVVELGRGWSLRFLRSRPRETGKDRGMTWSREKVQTQPQIYLPLVPEWVFILCITSVPLRVPCPLSLRTVPTAPETSELCSTVFVWLQSNFYSIFQEVFFASAWFGGWLLAGSKPLFRPSSDARHKAWYKFSHHIKKGGRHVQFLKYSKIDLNTNTKQ